MKASLFHKDKWKGAEKDRSHRDSGVGEWRVRIHVVEAGSPETESWVHHLPVVWPGQVMFSVSTLSFANRSY